MIIETKERKRTATLLIKESVDLFGNLWQSFIHRQIKFSCFIKGVGMHLKLSNL